MRLYKYLGPERVDVLRDAFIRFAPITALNDPFELKPHVAAMATPEYMRSQLEDGLDSLTDGPSTTNGYSGTYTGGNGGYGTV